MPHSIQLSLKPMEAEPVDDLPGGKGWLFEPKYDGFRCIAFRDGGEVRLQSKNQKALERYFPELADGLRELRARRFVIDGEIIIPDQPFETLQLRLRPAAPRVEKLAAEFPATLVAFDLLPDDQGKALLREPFADRRAALERIMKRVGKTPFLRLSKATRSPATARKWLGRSGLDGLVAKRLDGGGVHLACDATLDQEDDALAFREQWGRRDVGTDKNPPACMTGTSSGMQGFTGWP